MFQNSFRILLENKIVANTLLENKIFANTLLENQNSKQNLACILDMDVFSWRCNVGFVLDIDVATWRCMFQNSFRILVENQNSCQYSAVKTKF
jgi:hypothetical protein